MNFILVGVLEGTARNSLLRKLNEAYPNHQFEWFEARSIDTKIPEKHFSRLLRQIQGYRNQPGVKLVKLYSLHHEQQNKLYRYHHNPVLVPKEVADEEAVIEFIGNTFFPPWEVSAQGLSLLAILSKLLRNKSWNTDVSGHQWTKESDLLGQAPVKRKNSPETLDQAKDVLSRGKTSKLLLTKGGSQKKTPKEWSINSTYLPLVKRVFLDRDLSCLSHKELSNLLNYMLSDDPEFQVDDGIRSAKVLNVCEEVER